MFFSRFYRNQLQKCSSSYKNINKLSLKVYYLQEISKISSSRNDNYGLGYNADYKTRLYPVDHYTFNENDLKQLCSDIDSSISELSPSQLLSTAISYSNLSIVGKKEWKRLCYATLKHAYGNIYNINAISPSHISMILYSYAKKFVDHIPVTYRLLKCSVKSTGSLNERDISMLLYYIRRTKCVPKSLNNETQIKNAQILRAITLCLSKEGGNKLVRLTPSGLVSVVYNFTQIGMIPWSMIYHACNLIKKKANKLDYKSIGFHSRSILKLNIRDKKTLETFVSSLNDKKPIPLPTISSLLYSLAKLKYRPKSDLSFLMNEIKRCMFLFQDRDLSLIVYSLGQLGIRCEEVFESVGLFLKNRIEHQSPQHLSMLIRGYSKVGIYDKSVIELIVHNSLKLLTGFTVDQIVSLIDSLVVLGYFDEDSFLKFLDYFCSFPQDELGDHLVNQLNRIMYSIRLEHPEFTCKGPGYVRSLFDQYQGHFMIKENKDTNDSLYRTLKELDIDFMTDQRVGMYIPDAVLNNNISIEMLSQASICPMTKLVLGSAMMLKRHLNILGYNHIQINRDEWIKKSEFQRMDYIRELLKNELKEYLRIGLINVSSNNTDKHIIDDSNKTKKADLQIESIDMSNKIRISTDEDNELNEIKVNGKIEIKRPFIKEYDIRDKKEINQDVL